MATIKVTGFFVNDNAIIFAGINAALVKKASGFDSIYKALVGLC